MAEPYVGQIILFAGTYPPKNYVFCDGGLLQIYMYEALFAILGTKYGGDGEQTFGIPDLRGRVPVHAGASAGKDLPQVSLGQSWGSPTHNLTTGQMPAHTHHASVSAGIPMNIQASKEAANNIIGDGDYLAAANTVNDSGAVNSYSTIPGTLVKLGGVSDGGVFINVQPVGGNQRFKISQPSLGLNYCIAVKGKFPVED